MTPVYEVKTKHTKKVLEDFIGFTYRVKHPQTTFMIVVFAICFYTLTYIIFPKSLIAAIIFAVLGTFILVFAFTRKKIAASKLAKNDKNYQEQNEIIFVFGEKEFTVQDADNAGPQSIRYSQVAYIYENNYYYFVSVDNEMIHMIPKADFTVGDARLFGDFIARKSHQNIIPTYIPWKKRIQLMMEYRDMRYDARQAERKKKEEEKKKKR